MASSTEHKYSKVRTLSTENLYFPFLSFFSPYTTHTTHTTMPTLRLGSTAPDFEAQTTNGPISFHDYIGDNWAILFSHPSAETPICSTYVPLSIYSCINKSHTGTSKKNFNTNIHLVNFQPSQNWNQNSPKEVSR